MEKAAHQCFSRIHVSISFSSFPFSLKVNENILKNGYGGKSVTEVMSWEMDLKQGREGRKRIWRLMRKDPRAQEVTEMWSTRGILE